MVKDPIKLRQLVAYFKEDGADIQVTFEDQEWEEYEQMSMGSRLLKPYLDCAIKCMGFEEAIDNKEFVLRVTLENKET